jgi:hypothetical protein
MCVYNPAFSTREGSKSEKNKNGQGRHLYRAQRPILAPKQHPLCSKMGHVQPRFRVKVAHNRDFKSETGI